MCDEEGVGLCLVKLFLKCSWVVGIVLKEEGCDVIGGVEMELLVEIGVELVFVDVGVVVGFGENEIDLLVVVFDVLDYGLFC